MSMTKKDYEMLADSLNECITVCLANPLPKRTKAEVIREVALHLAATLQGDNPKFDRIKFLKACGITQ